MSRLQLISCEGKEQLTEERAREVAAKMRRRRPQGAVSAYHCVCCKAWHVGSTPPAKRKAPRQARKEVRARDLEYLEKQEAKAWSSGSRR